MSEKITATYRTTADIPNFTNYRLPGYSVTQNPYVFHERMKDLNIGEPIPCLNSDRIWRLGQRKSPHFPENSCGTNLMIYIQNPHNLDEITGLRDISYLELAPFCTISQKFLELKPNGLVVWAVGYEPKVDSESKRGGQSIETFHAHFLADFQGSLIPYDNKNKLRLPSKYRGERFSHYIEKLYAELIMHYIEEGDFTLYQPPVIGDKKNELLAQAGGYINKGGFLIEMSDISELASAIKTLDLIIRHSYSDLSNLFVTDGLRRGVRRPPSKPFTPKEIEDAYNKIACSQFSEHTKYFLRRITPYVLKSEITSQNSRTPKERPFREATYTATLLLDNDTKPFLCVTPHFYIEHATNRTDLGVIRGNVVDKEGTPDEVMPQNMQRSRKLYDELDVPSLFVDEEENATYSL